MNNRIKTLEMHKPEAYKFGVSKVIHLKLLIRKSGAIEWRKQKKVEYIDLTVKTVVWSFHNRYGYAIIIPQYTNEYYVNGTRYETYLEFIVASEEYNGKLR